MVEQRVPGAIYKRHASMRGTLAQCIQLRSVLAKLGAISLAKLEPAIWIMVKPFAQLRAWRQLSQPVVDRRSAGSHGQCHDTYEDPESDRDHPQWIHGMVIVVVEPLVVVVGCFAGVGLDGCESRRPYPGSRRRFDDPFGRRSERVHFESLLDDDWERRERDDIRQAKSIDT